MDSYNLGIALSLVVRDKYDPGFQAVWLMIHACYRFCFHFIKHMHVHHKSEKEGTQVDILSLYQSHVQEER